MSNSSRSRTARQPLVFGNSQIGRRSMSGWIRRPPSPHECARPVEVKYGDHGYVGSVWRCHCNKLWIFRQGWYFGEFLPWWHRTTPQWHRARWWELVRWSEQSGDGSL